jgi:hypothetical protein
LLKINAKSAQVGFKPVPVDFICGQLMQLLKINAKSAQVGFKPVPVDFICGQLMQLLKISAQSAQGLPSSGRFFLLIAHAISKNKCKISW